MSQQARPGVLIITVVIGATLAALFLKVGPMPAAAPPRPSPLFQAAEDGDLSGIKRLVQSGVDIKEQDRFGENAMFKALRSNNYEVADYLISQGLNIENADIFGRRISNYFVGTKNHFGIKWVLARGLYQHHRHEGGETELFTAARVGDVKGIALLLKHGFKARVANHKGLLPREVSGRFADNGTADLLSKHEKQEMIWDSVNSKRSGSNFSGEFQTSPRSPPDQ